MLRGNASVLLSPEQICISTLVDQLFVKRGAVLGQYKPLNDLLAFGYRLYNGKKSLRRVSRRKEQFIFIWLVHVCYPDFGKALTKRIF